MMKYADPDWRVKSLDNSLIEKDCLEWQVNIKIGTMNLAELCTQSVQKLVKIDKLCQDMTAIMSEES